MLVKEAKSIIARYVDTGGKCRDDDKVNLFLKQVLQYLMFKGQYGSVRKFCFHAHNGCFAMPYELETPLKVKIGGCVGSVWSKWFEYQSGNDLDDCVDASRALSEEPQTYPTLYPVPVGGAQIGCLGICSEDDDAHIIVKGVDSTGRVIHTTHRGAPIVGEYLSIRKGRIMQTQAEFAQITEIYKTPTKGYVELYWLRNEGTLKGFLAAYEPRTETPNYRWFRVQGACQPVTEISVIGRIRLKDYYADDDQIPFDNYQALTLAAQAINSQYNRDVAVAQQTDNWLKDVIKDEAEYKKVNNGEALEMFRPLTAGGVIKPLSNGITNTYMRGYGRGRR